jgi:hypothetical protein
MRRSLSPLREALQADYRHHDAKYFADKYGVSLSAVYTQASELGLTSNQIWESQKEDIIRDYLNGDSFKTLADRYGHFKGNVGKRLRTWGVNIRDASEARQTYDIDAKIFANIDSHEKAYWLGFIYADGNVYYGAERDDKRALQVCLAWKDEEHVKRLRVFLKAEVPLYPDKAGLRLIIHNIRLVNDLARLGVHPCKSLTLTFPSNDQVPACYRHSFILGYFDGDGSINSGPTAWRWQIIGTDEFNLVIREELVAFGFPCTSLTREKRSGQGRLSYLTYGGCLHPTEHWRVKHHLPRLYHYLYRDSPIWLPRKKERFEKYLAIRYPNGWQQFITV